ncbi:MAG: hypothetical protein JXB62_07845 [Pirellulales bacterium]|nr:hypothetical protein [Pirellulales bacterium]
MPGEPPHTDSMERRAKPSWRSRWPLRGRTTLVLSIVMFWVLAMVVWIVATRPASWREWLANLEFSPAGSGTQRADGETGRRAKPPTELAYFGEGRAELGDYSVRLFDPITGTMLRTDFRLEGRTACGSKQAFDEFMRNNNRLLREQVTVTVRSCQVSDLVEPDLTLLGKKIVSRVNRSLGQRFLKSADLKNFSLHESVDRSAFVRYDSADEAEVP